MKQSLLVAALIALATAACSKTEEAPTTPVEASAPVAAPVEQSPVEVAPAADASAPVDAASAPADQSAAK